MEIFASAIVGFGISFGVITQASSAGQPAQDPIANAWIQFGVLGLVVVGILYLKVIVPGWVYQAEVERGKQKDEIIKEKDAEIHRLRDFAEEQTIPLVQRALVLIEHAETRGAEWKMWQDPTQGTLPPTGHHHP